MAGNKFKSKIVLDTKYLTQLKRELNKLDKTEIDFGWINKRKYTNSKKNKSRAGMYIASIAYMNEKGHYTQNNDGATIYIPSRPYFQQSLHDTPFLKESLVKLYNNCLRGMRYEHVFKFIGQDLVDNVKKSVSKQNYKALSPKTISIKDSSIQWIDSGKMLDNITYKITYKRKGVSNSSTKF